MFSRADNHAWEQPIHPLGPHFATFYELTAGEESLVAMTKIRKEVKRFVEKGK